MRARGMRRPAWSALTVSATAVLVAALAWGPARATAQDGGDAEITYPVEGGNVAGPDVLVAYEADTDGDTRVALVVDGAVDIDDEEPLEETDGVVLDAGNPAVVPGLDPGEHAVQLVLTDEDDRPLADQDAPQVAFSVLEPLPVAVQRGTCEDAEEDPAFALDDTGSGVGDQAAVGVTIDIEREGEDEGEDPDAEATGEADGDDGQDGEEEPLPIGVVPEFPVEISDTTVEVEIEELLAEPHTVTVFARGLDRVEDGDPAACGEIGGPVFGGLLRIGLREQNDSGVVGVATVFDEGDDGDDDGDQVRIFVEVHRDLTQAEATATPTRAATATATPTEEPAEAPAEVPTEAPAEVPTKVPAEVPTEVPTEVPAEVPTEVPAEAPTDTPVPPA